VRNRELLVEAAAITFREEGLAASVNTVARRAGVNVATLYRHFPTKDDLVAAVLDAVLQPLVEARDRALAAMGAGAVLATFLREAQRLQTEHRGLVDALGGAPPSLEVRERLREPAVDVVEPIVEIAHRDGELRRDLDAVDLLVALRMIGVPAAAPRLSDREPERYVEMVLRGLRPG
jgi:AcrR family transcriptional regulator